MSDIYVCYVDQPIPTWFLVSILWHVWDHLDVTWCLRWENFWCSAVVSQGRKKQQYDNYELNWNTVCILGTTTIYTWWQKHTIRVSQLIGQKHCRNVLVVTGGYSWNSILARTESLNMTVEEGNRWRRLAPLLKPRYLHACSPVQLGAEVHLPHNILESTT